MKSSQYKGFVYQILWTTQTLNKNFSQHKLLCNQAFTRSSNANFLLKRTEFYAKS